MNQTLEPREVERPFIGRWLRTSLALIVRSPVQFGLLIVLLVCFDDAIWTSWGLRVAKLWSNAFGALLLGLIWVFIAALARGADDTSRVTSHGQSLRSLLVGFGLEHSCPRPVPPHSISSSVGACCATGLHYSQIRAFSPAPGRRRRGDSAQRWPFLPVFFRAFYLSPALALIPDIPPRLTRPVSLSAARKNGTVAILLVWESSSWAAALAEIVPLFGLTEALAVSSSVSLITSPIAMSSSGVTPTYRRQSKRRRKYYRARAIPHGIAKKG